MLLSLTECFYRSSLYQEPESIWFVTMNYYCYCFYYFLNYSMTDGPFPIGSNYSLRVHHTQHYKSKLPFLILVYDELYAEIIKPPVLLIRIGKRSVAPIFICYYHSLTVPDADTGHVIRIVNMMTERYRKISQYPYLCCTSCNYATLLNVQNDSARCIVIDLWD